MSFYSINDASLAVQTPAELVSQTPTAPPAKKRYVVGLDALRAIAALMVCLFHYTNGMLPKLIVPATKAAFSNGALGVDIFFVISGFIIPYSLIGKGYQLAGILPYLKKRILRINPPAYACILLTLAQAFFIDYVIQHNTQYTRNITWGQVINSLLFTVPFTNYKWINGVFWTLAIEFQFYIFIGLLFNSLFSKPFIYFIGIYALVIAASLLPHTSSIGFLSYSSMFALGGVALFWQQQRLSLVSYLGSILFFGAIAYWQLGLYAALLGVGTTVAINTLAYQIPGLSFLGKLSYSLYLIHAVVGTTAEFVLVKLLPPTSDARKVLLTATCLALAIGSSYIFYRLVEQPFMRLASQARR